MTSILVLLAVASLGLAAGALLTEAAILVPFWRSLAPQAFLDWYREHASLLLRFFGPLEVVATLLAVLAACVAWLGDGAGAPWLGLAALLAIGVLGTFPAYFQRVNASFAKGTIPIEQVPPELRRWARWHAMRTALATLAFLCAATAALAGGFSATAIAWK